MEGFQEKTGKIGDIIAENDSSDKGYTFSNNLDQDVTGMGLMSLDLPTNSPQNSGEIVDRFTTGCLICGPPLELTQCEYTKLISCLDIQSEIHQLLKILSPPNETDACCRRCLDLMKTFINLKNSFQSIRQKIISLHIDAQLRLGDSLNRGVLESVQIDADTNIYGSNKQDEEEEVLIKHENIEIESDKITNIEAKKRTRKIKTLTPANACRKEVLVVKSTLNSTQKRIKNRKIYPSDLRKIKCQYCDKTFFRRRALVEHERTHTGEKPFKCRYCSREFHREMSCVSHEKTEHVEKPFRCKMCFKKFQTKDECEQHESMHTAPRPFHCQFCARTFERRDECNRHERSHTGEKPFKCLHCDKKFNTKSARKKHEKTKHPGLELSKEECTQKEKITVNKIHSCDYCEITFDEKSYLLEHEKIHEFKCFHCGKSYWGMKALKSHEKYCIKEKQFKCTFCEMAFSHECALKEHLRIHTGEKPYICQYCSKGFTQRGTLTVHERSLHTGVRPFKCQYCEEGFPTRRTCIEHERFHTGERPFKCDYCDKSFARKSNWRDHVNTHLGIKPKICSYCGKGFRDRRQLTEHERTHTGERPFRCQHCDKAFAKKSGCTAHMKKHHWGEGNKDMLKHTEKSDTITKNLQLNSSFSSWQSDGSTSNVFPTPEVVFPGNNVNSYMYNMHMPGP